MHSSQESDLWRRLDDIRLALDAVHAARDSRALRIIHEHLHAVLLNQEAIMTTSAEALAAVQATNSRVEALITLFAEQKKQLADILAGVVLPTGVQADIDALFAATTAEAANVDKAITTTPSGTPAPTA